MSAVLVGRTLLRRLIIVIVRLLLRPDGKRCCACASVRANGSDTFGWLLLSHQIGNVLRVSRLYSAHRHRSIAHVVTLSVFGINNIIVQRVWISSLTISVSVSDWRKSSSRL